MNKSHEQNSLRVPVQQRSRDTLRRIFDATRKLLNRKRFQEISIQEIATEAGCGVGTVYGRFKNKSALLASLEQEVVTDIVDRQNSFLTARDWTDITFEKRVAALIEHMMAGYQRHGAALRELISRIHLKKDGASGPVRKSMSTVFRQDVEFLVESLHRRSTKHATRVVGLGLISATLTMQNRMLQIRTSPINVGFDESFLKLHLVKLVIAYVRSEFPDRA